MIRTSNRDKGRTFLQFAVRRWLTFWISKLPEIFPNGEGVHLRMRSSEEAISPRASTRDARRAAVTVDLLGENSSV